MDGTARQRLAAASIDGGSHGPPELLRRPHAGVRWVLRVRLPSRQPALLPRLRLVVGLLILAAGLGIQVARIGSRRPWNRHVSRLTVALGAAIVAWAVLFPVVRAVRYRLAVDGLPDVAGETPNVLLLILDTVSAREMSLYGYDRRTTPTLESLASHGVVFDRAIAAAPWTLPSHASMFTGYRADRLPARYLVPLQGDQHVVAEEFAEAGYVTAGFVGNLEYTARASAWPRGFHWYVDFVPSWSSALMSSSIGRLLAGGANQWLSAHLQAAARTPGR
jgi:hypothetical protein